MKLLLAFILFSLTCVEAYYSSYAADIDCSTAMLPLDKTVCSHMDDFLKLDKQLVKSSRVIHLMSKATSSKFQGILDDNKDHWSKFRKICPEPPLHGGGHGPECIPRKIFMEEEQRWFKDRLENCPDNKKNHRYAYRCVEEEYKNEIKMLSPYQTKEALCRLDPTAVKCAVPKLLPLPPV